MSLRLPDQMGSVSAVIVSMGRILITGIAGFIGSQVAKHFLEQGEEVVGIDNLNAITDPTLKWQRLQMLGLDVEDIQDNHLVQKEQLRFYKMDLNDEEGIKQLFTDHAFNTVIHLAANTGVRNSLKQPQSYLQANVLGFEVLLRCCRAFSVNRVLFASSSSVYGMNEHTPFQEDDDASHPLSVYAASKKADELLAHTYAHLYGLSTIGLRFFTVYGPWTRSDMAAYLFMDAIQNGHPLEVYNNGDMYRDFTYVGDVVKVIELIRTRQQLEGDGKANYRIFNVGHHEPVKLTQFIRLIEQHMGQQARTENHPLQPGDMTMTFADTEELRNYIGYVPDTDLDKGLEETVRWYQTLKLESAQ